MATQIEQSIPGRVTSVNKVIYRLDGSILTDLDIESDNIVIQVKTGDGKGLTKQLVTLRIVQEKLLLDMYLMLSLLF